MPARAAKMAARGASAVEREAGFVPPLAALLILTRVQMQSVSSSLGLSRGDGASSGIGFKAFLLGRQLLFFALAIVASLAAAGIFGIFCPQVLPGLAVTVTTLLALVFTFVGATGSLFGFRDYDMTMALPISTRIVVLSRVGALFVTQLIWSIVIMVPMYVVYFLLMPATVASVVTVPVSILLASALPVSLGIFVAFLLAVGSSRFKFASAVYVIAVIAGSLGVLALSMNSQQLSASVSGLDLDGMVGGMRAVACTYPLAGMVAAAADGVLVQLLPFAAISVAAVAVAIEVLARNFMRVSALLEASGGARRVDIARASRGGTSPVRAMVLKELRMVLGVPQVMVNSCFGGFMLLALSLFMAAAGKDSASSMIAQNYLSLGADGAGTFTGLIDLMAPWIFVFCLGLCSPSAVLVSMEGPSAWVMATAPVPARDIMRAKLLVSMLWGVPVAAVSGALMLVGGMALPAVIEGVLLGLIVCAAMAALGLMVDARRPNYTWNSPNEVVKRGRGVVVTVVAGMVLAIGGAVLTVLAALKVGLVAGQAVILAAAVLMLAMGLACFKRACNQDLYLA